MWPLLLDMTKDESMQSLRNLELEAYSHLVSALRAQGPLNPDKRKLLQDTGNVLNISQERHKAEIRRALSDEKLSTIAYHVTGQNEYSDDWAQEGRRVVPLMPRMAPQTAYSAMADEVAENTEQSNKQLPLPANTERKRPAIIQTSQNLPGESNKPNSFRVPDMPKHEESKKRKFSEGSTLAQHLLGPSKMSKIQQIYRQKTKSKTKEQFAKVKTEPEQQEVIQNKIQHPVVIQKPPPIVKVPMSAACNTIPINGPKGNILQTINLQPPLPTPEDQAEPIQDVNNFVVHKFNEQNHITSQPTNINENLTNRLKLLTKSNNNIMFKTLTTPTSANLNVDLQKTLKMCPSRKPITKTVPTTGQKLIVVSNAQTIPSSSILQRTLTIPFVKNISVKNFDKFKIVTTTATPISLATSIVNSNNFNSVKHKVVTVRTSNPTGTGKKVFPLTQLQMLSKGSIKVLPLGGKIVGKSSTSTTPTSMYIMNTMGNMQTLTKGINNLPIITATKIAESAQVTPVSPSTDLLNSACTKNAERLQDAVKNPSIVFTKGNAVPVVEDFDSKIDEFHIQTVPLSSQDSVVEVQCEDENKMVEADSNVTLEKSGIVNLPVIDSECLISESEIADIPGKVLNIDPSSRDVTEPIEVEIEECTNDTNEISVFTDDHLNQTDYKQEMTNVGYVEN